MESNHHVPAFIGKINVKYGIPRLAMVVNTVLSMVMVSVFRDWATLAAVLSTATLIAYLTGPVTAVSLRKMAPQLTRPIRLKHLNFMAPFSFVLASLAVYWAMWPTTIEVIFVILLGLPFYFYYEWQTGFVATRKAFFCQPLDDWLPDIHLHHVLHWCEPVQWSKLGELSLGFCGYHRRFVSLLLLGNSQLPRHPRFLPSSGIESVGQSKLSSKKTVMTLTAFF